MSNLNFYRENPEPPFSLVMNYFPESERKVYEFWSAEKMAEFYDNCRAQRENKKGKKRRRKKKS